MDTNPTRKRYADNKKAFDEVLGDPFAYPEPKDGWYNTFKRKSTLGSARYSDEGHSTSNAARPSQQDFFCDIENVIEQVITNKILLTKFITTYIVGDIESTDTLPQAARTVLEQRIGRLLKAYKIHPVGDYFTTLRRGAPRPAAQA